MRAMTCVAAALVLAFATACEDRDRDETADRIDNTAEDVGAEVREGANDVENAAEEAVGEYGYDRRDEFRRDVNARLEAIDRDLADAEAAVGDETAEARVQAVAAAKEARRAAERSISRLGDATRDTWEEVRGEVAEALAAAERSARDLRADAKPMGGAGPN